MDKKRLAIIFAFLFLIQSVAYTQDSLQWTSPLDPTSKVSLNKPEISFLKKYDIYILCLGLLIYKLDVVERYSKSEIRERIKEQYENAFFDLDGIDFDLNNIDYFKRKGFTRYYPFNVLGKPYIIRIFRTDEKHFQSKVEVLYEGKVRNPSVTFQILKGINSILSDCKIRPQKSLTQSKSSVSP